MDMAKLLGGLGTVKAINNFYVQKDLTDLALIVSTIIFIAVDNPVITDSLLTLLFYSGFC
jgi:hypothetical protein